MPCALQVTAAGKAVLVTGADNRLGQLTVKQLDELVWKTFRNPRITCSQIKLVPLFTDVFVTLQCSVTAA